MKRLLIALLLILPQPALAAKVQEIKTPGGFTLWLVEEHSLPIVNVEISFKEAGLAYDPANKEGRGNMVAALLLEGAADRDAKYFNEALEENAIHLNAGVNDDTLNISMQTLWVHKEEAFALMADALIHPRFDEDAIERARAKMIALIEEQSESPYYKLSSAFAQMNYGTHPYARMGLGTEASVKALKIEDFKEFTGRYITKENIIISVVGDISPEIISALIDKYLAALPAKYNPDGKVEDITIPTVAQTMAVEHDIPQTMVSFSLPGMKRNDPDYIPAFVMNYLLGGGGLSSKLGTEIRVKRGLAYSVRTQLEPKAHAAIWRGNFSTKNAEAQNALSVLKDTLAAFREKGVTQQELDDAKSFLTGSFMLDLSSNGEVADFLNIMQYHKLGIDYLEKRNEMVDKVSLADITRVSHRLINPQALRVVIVGKPELPQ